MGTIPEITIELCLKCEEKRYHLINDFFPCNQCKFHIECKIEKEFLKSIPDNELY